MTVQACYDKSTCGSPTEVARIRTSPPSKEPALSSGAESGLSGLSKIIWFAWINPYARQSGPASHVALVSPFTSHVSRPQKGRVISLGENGILYGDQCASLTLFRRKQGRGIHEFDSRYHHSTSI
mgnify:CR=1 FL=1